MEDYNKIIESLGVKFVKAKSIKILKPVTVNNLYEVENKLILVNKGEVLVGEERLLAKEGDFAFIPGGKSHQITYGRGSQIVSVSNDNFITNKGEFFHSITHEDLLKEGGDSFSYISFEAKVFDSVNFFASLDIPAFIFTNDTVKTLHDEIFHEMNMDEPGADRMVKVLTEHLLIEVFRHIVRNKLFVEQLATNSTYFKDPRLIDIFNYINEHLGGDLSNKKLAEVANVSEDYVGQYFKMLTGINPQDYIEYQRMEEAVTLLRTSKKSIRDIGQEVGYKDTAYFCRRFKMMFGIPAGKMRRRESLMNV
ncbi:helix-turn-helix domain-containing protein [Marivirga sp. S37H4]|uniref:Helix-turn-helix domain-containing protein n=1 Tax=Marivirga aurantiaca TaxID=2802615 RepID=A0A934WYP3_9BACT|nr:AraC family transcriptional regulator [Marivirga aurantiaca]MBK6265604.1 helix-turn-helix domain-containing protein [Marivirga aurantiaca]